MERQSRRPLDRSHDRSHPVPHGSLRHLPGHLPLLAPNVPSVRRKLVRRGRHDAIRIRSGRHTFREAFVPYPWHRRRLQFARWIDDPLHFRAVCALFLWPGLESKVEICGSVLTRLDYFSMK